MGPSTAAQNGRNQSTVERPRSVRLAGSALGHRAHICAFFSSPDEEYEVLTPFIREGLDLGEKAVHTVDPRQRSEHLKRLTSSGIDVETATRSGQFELWDWTNTHLRHGQCNLSHTLALFQQVAMDARQDGFPLVRFVTHMEWALETHMDVNDLLAYEAQANDTWMRQDGPVNPVICTYDLNRFSGDVIVDVMRTHPLVIIGGILQENPFFVDPEEFLGQLHERPRTQLRRLA
jgi:hypothetical protein